MSCVRCAVYDAVQDDVCVLSIGFVVSFSNRPIKLSSGRHAHFAGLVEQSGEVSERHSNYL